MLKVPDRLAFISISSRYCWTREMSTFTNRYTVLRFSSPNGPIACLTSTNCAKMHCAHGGKRIRHPGSLVGSTRRHRPQDASMASANLYCELEFIRQIPPCTADACHGKEVHRRPTTGAPKVPQPTNSCQKEKQPFVCRTFTAIDSLRWAQGEGKPRKGDGKGQVKNIDAPSHGTGGKKDSEHTVRSGEEVRRFFHRTVVCRRYPSFNRNCARREHTHHADGNHYR